ncbi:2-keto-3-deoxy-phosphogluconate aldolase [Microbacterium sp. SLBN-154]|uniref:bifunctional 4-hydroxy-2-oxoglutarate aldolase/2-dehydro-3-deoxy-phosphogluconate aldolase n=1 Tax=Microbacterium sp. SLBN-154 TaxID=2768458 RepID=UPI001150AA50|nr:bifunctional 4-hydroxy-2-oxoglutarate aldolase/2-dehydro-3-deoxy-phosphogluconate aldolase [Microbacterium sp. SLBN-154]TQK17649.1 2-keto-3-deoxy-phosphogluconate aldolase [Microbacterium sp. SLBN-154]
MHDHSVVVGLRKQRILPLITSDDMTLGAELIDALVASMLTTVEVTLRRPGSLDFLSSLATSARLEVGAGTVMSGSQAKRAISHGASFLISPGYSAEVHHVATTFDRLYIPGVATATELMQALNKGVRVVKFFPAATAGGPDAIRALAAVAPAVQWIPTGGITAESVVDYLRIPEVVAVGGSWMIPSDALHAQDFATIRGALGSARRSAENN